MINPKIDIHVLTHSGTRQEWLEQCLASLEGHPVVVHVVKGIEGSVGAGRAKGYALGDCEFVGYIDSDDYVLPGHYDLCLKALELHKSVVPREHVEYMNGSRHSFTKPMHNGAVYRRVDIERLMPAMSSAPFCADILTRQSLRPYQMSHAGCVWRLYGGAAHNLITEESLNIERADWNLALKNEDKEN